MTWRGASLWREATNGPNVVARRTGHGDIAHNSRRPIFYKNAVVTTPFSDPHHARAITLLSLAAFASAASVRLCDPMLPELARQFSADTTEAARVVSFFAIAYGLLQAFFGTLGDRIGKYRLIALCTLASTVGTLAAACTTSLDGLVAARFLTGMTAAGVIPLAMAWIGDTVAYEHRQATLARFLAGQIIGLVSGQFIGGLFTDTLGWRWSFIFLAIIFAGVGWHVLQESRHNPHAKQVHTSHLSGSGMLAQVGAVFATPWARIVLAIVFVEGMLVFGPMAFVPSFLHDRFAISLTTAAAMIAAFGAGGIVYIIFARRILQRIGEAGLASIGGGLLAVAWLVMAMEQNWQWTPLATFLAGLGYYMLHNTLQTNATQMTPAARGTAVSLFASAFFLGQSCGVFVAARVFNQSGSVALFAGAALLLPLLSSLFAILLARHHRQAASNPVSPK